MRGRYPAPSGISYSFGPGPVTPAVRLIIAGNVAMFLLSWFVDGIELALGLLPERVFAFGAWQVWRPVSYMFLHGDLFHILFNMLALWMFGVELERMWGTRYFTRFYFVSGVGAAATTLLLSLLPGIVGSQLYYSLTIGASGAVYGVLLAYALYFPNRPILMFLLFPVPAKYFVMIIGAISLLSSMGAGGGVAHTTHLGGLVAAYLYLKGWRLNLWAEIRYRYLKWRINRSRRRFDVYSGGRTDRRIH